MKLLGFSVLGVVMVLLAIGVVFTLLKPLDSNHEKEIAVRQDVVLGTASRLDFSSNGSL